MTDTPPADAKFIIGPYGTRLSIADLPPPSTERWVIRRKAEVVATVQGGLLSFEEALKRYEVTPDEFLAWQSSIDRHGIRGLKIKRFDHHRRRAIYALS